LLDCQSFVDVSVWSARHANNAGTPQKAQQQKEIMYKELRLPASPESLRHGYAFSKPNRPLANLRLHRLDDTAADDPETTIVDMIG
jgi:sugar diacid utilization regulator